MANQTPQPPFYKNPVFVIGVVIVILLLIIIFRPTKVPASSSSSSPPPTPIGNKNIYHGVVGGAEQGVDVGEQSVNMGSGNIGVVGGHGGSSGKILKKNTSKVFI